MTFQEMLDAGKKVADKVEAGEDAGDKAANEADGGSVVDGFSAIASGAAAGGAVAGPVGAAAGAAAAYLGWASDNPGTGQLTETPEGGNLAPVVLDGDTRTLWHHAGSKIFNTIPLQLHTLCTSRPHESILHADGTVEEIPQEISDAKPQKIEALAMGAFMPAGRQWGVDLVRVADQGLWFARVEEWMRLAGLTAANAPDYDALFVATIGSPRPRFATGTTQLQGSLADCLLGASKLPLVLWVWKEGPPDYGKQPPLEALPICIQVPQDRYLEPGQTFQAPVDPFGGNGSGSSKNKSLLPLLIPVGLGLVGLAAKAL